MNTPRAVGRNGSHLDFKFFYSVRLGARGGAGRRLAVVRGRFAVRRGGGITVRTIDRRLMQLRVYYSTRLIVPVEIE